MNMHKDWESEWKAYLDHPPFKCHNLRDGFIDNSHNNLYKQKQFMHAFTRILHHKRNRPKISSLALCMHGYCRFIKIFEWSPIYTYHDPCHYIFTLMMLSININNNWTKKIQLFIKLTYMYSNLEMYI